MLFLYCIINSFSNIQIIIYKTVMLCFAPPDLLYGISLDSQTESASNSQIIQ